ncbi:hypothetical protein [Coleofasciculus sp. FACHB-129]|uniref:hypothetical protein n=1 Tax=Cyanophyceae TaxID=3028117 RepID=UPI001684D065|nr:hypothetical protein [Coleofasciculus sp. FACHB-129]
MAFPSKNGEEALRARYKGASRRTRRIARIRVSGSLMPMLMWTLAVTTLVP